MADRNDTHPNIAPVERRVDAIQAAFDERGFKPAEVIEQFDRISSRTAPERGVVPVQRRFQALEHGSAERRVVQTMLQVADGDDGERVRCGQLELRGPVRCRGLRMPRVGGGAHARLGDADLRRIVAERQRSDIEDADARMAEEASRPARARRPDDEEARLLGRS